MEMGRSRRCKHFRPYGFIKTGDFGSTGLQLYLSRKDKATISAAEPDSTAAKAGIQPADTIMEVECQPLTASTGEEAKKRLFGKVRDQFQLNVRRAGRPIRLSNCNFKIGRRLGFSPSLTIHQAA
jgi:C-terminal processing protease CtpA/Prc